MHPGRQLVRRRKVTPTELLDAAIARVEARNPAINAVVLPLYDYARKAIADGLPDGPFRGVPYLLKDLTASLAGVRTMRGSRFFADMLPAAADSEHVARLKRAGLVVFGRTSTCELGLSLTCEPQLYGATKNPWDPARISGGSSGGAAAATGARIVPMAHERRLRVHPRAGCVLRAGRPQADARPEHDGALHRRRAGARTEHAVTLTVRDCAALLDATAGPGPGDPYTAPAPARPFLAEAGAPAGRPPGPPGCSAHRTAHRSIPRARRWSGRSPASAANSATTCPRCTGVDREAIVPTFLHARGCQLGGDVALTRRRAARRAAARLENVTFDTAARGEQHPRGPTTSGPPRPPIASAADGRLPPEARRPPHPGLATPGAVKLGWIDMMLEDVDEYWRQGIDVLPIHRVVQHHGPAGDHAPGGAG